MRKHQNLRRATVDILARRDRINAELKSIAGRNDLPADHWSHTWAGTYYVGDGLGMNVRIVVAPNSGVAYTWNGCLGLYDGNHGDIDGTFDDDDDGRPDGLRIKWALQSEGGYDFDSDKYYFVRWSGPAHSPGRYYMVPEAQVSKLVKNYNEGGVARDRMFSAPKKYDEANDDPRETRPAVEGVPQLPAKWAQMLITAPLDAKVISVTATSSVTVTGAIEATDARVALDKGRADGLYLGMKIPAGPARSGPGRLTIDKLDEHTAEATFRAFVSAGQPSGVPVVGQLIPVTSSARVERDP